MPFRSSVYSANKKLIQRRAELKKWLIEKIPYCENPDCKYTQYGICDMHEYMITQGHLNSIKDMGIAKRIYEIAFLHTANIVLLCSNCHLNHKPSKETCAAIIIERPNEIYSLNPERRFRSGSVALTHLCEFTEIMVRENVIKYPIPKPANVIWSKGVIPDEIQNWNRDI